MRFAAALMRLVLVVPLALLAGPTLAQESKRPNIVYIVADDLGWADIGFRGSDIQTPNIDRLAAGGLELNDFYVEPMCTPTRAALMTGRYPMRYGLQTGVIPSGGLYGLDTEELLLPQALKAAGYETALVGKWHLGHGDPKYWPMQRGFDHFYGALVGEIDHFKHESHGVRDWYRGNQVLREEGYDQTLFGAEAVRLIETHDFDVPLFLYLAFTAPHTPYQAPQEYLDRYPKIADEQRKAYAAMISAMDDEIGRVLNALDQRGELGDTLVVFHSDNGGTRSAMFAGESKVTGELPPNNGALRDGKGTLYEGGARVGAILNWPGKIAPGRADGLAHVVDMYPTLLGLAGGSTDGAKPLDGIDLWPMIADGQASPRSEIVYNVEPFRAAVRQGDWKLLWSAVLPQRLELYNLADDLSEQTNLAAQEPAKVQALQDRINELARQATMPLLLGEAIRLTYGTPPSTPDMIFQTGD